MKKKRKYYTIEDWFFLTGCMFLVVICLAIVVFFRKSEWVHHMKQQPCLFHMMTGYYCPGCGGTRAATALLRGHILRSLYYHPIVIYGMAVYGCFMVTQTVERISRHTIPIGMRYRNGYVWVALVILVLNFSIKNVLHYLYGYTM